MKVSSDSNRKKHAVIDCGAKKAPFYVRRYKRMGAITEKDNRIDVICQHNRDRTIMPIKIRLTDEYGERQTYGIIGYKDLSANGDYMLPNGIAVRGHIRMFECRISVFGSIRLIRISYNSEENQWRIVTVS